MANIIKIKRGLSSNLSKLTLAQGELAITTDTQELYTANQSNQIVKINHNDNTTYTLTKEGSSIVLTGTDGYRATIADENTVVSSATAPSDTSKLWFDTTTKLLKSYNSSDAEWQSEDIYVEVISDLSNTVANLSEDLTSTKQNLNNNYFTKTETNQSLEAQKSEITSAYINAINTSIVNSKTEIKQELSKEGIETLKNKIVNIDNNGIVVSKNSNTDFTTNINDTILECKNGNTEIFNVSKDGMSTTNSKLKGKTNLGETMLYEKYNHTTLGTGLAHFWMGE